MSPIKKEKVGLREKLLAALGKRIMYWRAKKVPQLLINLSYRETIRLLIELYGDAGSALKAMFQLARDAGPDFLNEWVESASPIFSKHVGDHALWIKSGYYGFTGDHITYIEYFPPEKEGDPHRVVWRIDKCFLCAGLDQDNTIDIKKEDLKDFGWGAAIAGIFTATTNMINEYAGIEFTCHVRETKCLLKGDPYGEFVAEFYPKEKDAEKP
ncbi:MAG: hypothetical protein ACTSYB_14980 [Candidatus Helarchaeota archaeon]